MTKPIAKSLHTVSALVNTARYIMGVTSTDPETALHMAKDVLGLGDKPDPYGLEATALKQLKGGRK